MLTTVSIAKRIAYEAISAQTAGGSTETSIRIGMEICNATRAWRGSENARTILSKQSILRCDELVPVQGL